MDENVDAALRFGALQLALVTAAIHLWVGWQRLFAYIQAGTPFVTRSRCCSCRPRSRCSLN